MTDLSKWIVAYEKHDKNHVCPKCQSIDYVVYKQERPRSVVFLTICKTCGIES